MLSDHPDCGLDADVQPLDAPLPRDRPAVVLLDLRTHATRALDRLARWRDRKAPVAVLVVSDRVQQDARRKALELGVDDFILAPVDREELSLRLARLQGEPPKPPTVLQLVDCVVDLDTRRVARVGGAERLTPTEARLLGFLAARPGATVDHRTLLGEVWGYREGVRSRTLTVTMQRLRAKVEAYPDEPAHLKTVYGAGYRFEPLDSTPRVSPPSLSWPSLLDSQRTNLPPQVRPLRGRAVELGQLEERVHGDRWTAVTGQAGVGKRRLVEELLARHARRLPGGAFVVPGLDVCDEVDARVIIGRVLGVFVRREEPPAATRLAWALHARGPTWLALPGLPEWLHPLVRALLDGAPELRVVSTAAAAPPGVAELALDAPGEGEAIRILLDDAVGGSATEAVRDLVLAVGRRPSDLARVAALLPILGPADLQRRIEEEGTVSVAWALAPEAVRTVVQAVVGAGPAVQAGALDGRALAEALRRGLVVPVAEDDGRRLIGPASGVRAFVGAGARSLALETSLLADPPGAIDPALAALEGLDAARAWLDEGDPLSARRAAMTALETLAVEGRREAYLRGAVLLAESQRRLGRAEEAREVLLTCLDDLDLHPVDAQHAVWIGLAWAHAEEGLADAAEEALGQARTLGAVDVPQLDAAIARAARLDAS